MFDSKKRSEFLRYWAVPIFLVFIASIHMYRVYAYNQSSWGAGCGFGMFAKVDYHDTRYFRCKVKTADGQTLDAYFRPSLEREDMQARVVPSSFNLSVLANGLTEQPWYAISIFNANNELQLLETIAFTDNEATSYIESRFGNEETLVRSEPIEIVDLNLELYGVRFDQERRRLDSHLITTVELQKKNGIENNVAVTY